MENLDYILSILIWICVYVCIFGIWRRKLFMCIHVYMFCGSNSIRFFFFHAPANFTNKLDCSVFAFMQLLAKHRTDSQSFVI